MVFRSYCLVILGRVEGVKEEISKISETAVRYVDAKGIVIATFSTVATTLELKEFFTLNNRSFVLFEMGDGNYGVNLTNKAIHEHLFGQHDNTGSDILNTLTGKLLSDISASMGSYIVPEPVISGSSQTRSVRSKNIDYDDVALTKLSVEEREKIVNNIIDKGVENLNEHDKKVLKKISKLGKK